MLPLQRGLYFPLLSRCRVENIRSALGGGCGCDTFSTLLECWFPALPSSLDLRPLPGSVLLPVVLTAWSSILASSPLSREARAAILLLRSHLWSSREESRYSSSNEVSLFLCLHQSTTATATITATITTRNDKTKMTTVTTRGVLSQRQSDAEMAGFDVEAAGFDVDMPEASAAKKKKSKLSVAATHTHTLVFK